MMIPLSLLLALGIDRWLGEPAPRWHPVVWMGRYLGWAGARVQCGVRSAVAADLPAFWRAAIYWLAGAAFVYGAFWLLEWAVLQASGALVAALGWVSGSLLGALLLALLLKPLLAWRMLQTEVLAVAVALAASLVQGRERLRWLVSRDTAALAESQVRESAIESLAENLNDSVVAPIFWFVLLGLPGAALYRFANTADAMWGYPGSYHGGYWQWAGKWAARFDDALNYLPARLTGLLLWALVAPGVPLQTLRRQAAQTPSPNSGWPMAAMALALGVGLRKPGVYALNPAGRTVQAGDVAQALAYASEVVLVIFLLALAAVLFTTYGWR